MDGHYMLLKVEATPSKVAAHHASMVWASTHSQVIQPFNDTVITVEQSITDNCEHLCPNGYSQFSNEALTRLHSPLF